MENNNWFATIGGERRCKCQQSGCGKGGDLCSDGAGDVAWGKWKGRGSTFRQLLWDEMIFLQIRLTGRTRS